MNKEQKQEAVKEIGAALKRSSAVFAVDYRGITVSQAAELRGRLREAEATFSVVKNRLAKRTTAEVGAEALDDHLVGPTALAYVRGDAVIAAKAISQFASEHKILAYKGGIMEGEPLDPEQFKEIARLPGLDQLRGQLVGLTASPLTGLAQGLNGLIGGLATQLGQIAERGLVGAEATEAEPAAEEAPEPGTDSGQAAPEAGAEQAGEAEAEAEEAPEGAEAEGAAPEAGVEAAAAETSEQAEQDDGDAGGDPADEEATKED